MEAISNILHQYGYEFVKVLYNGHSSQILLIKCLNYHQTYICKVTHDNPKDRSINESYSREVDALLALDHPNIVRIFDAFRKDLYLFLIIEYCSQGTLNQFIGSTQKLRDTQLMTYARDLISALCAMHSRGYSHGNIQPSNILLDETGSIKLCDFGSARGTSSVETDPNLIVKFYSAPEISYSSIYDPFKADVWSLGVTLYSIASGRSVFSSKNINYCIHELRNGRDHLIYISRTMRTVINACLTKNPAERPTIYEVKRMLETVRLSKRALCNSRIQSGVLASSAKSSLTDTAKFVAQKNRNSYSGW